LFSQRELGNKFHSGSTSGTASNVTIIDGDQYTGIIGYGHAVYAVRNKRTGDVVTFMGWDRCSQSTTQQFTALSLRRKADYKSEKSPDSMEQAETIAREVESGSVKV
jgi:hypothetical protein